jgi:hypothetical protein
MAVPARKEIRARASPADYREGSKSLARRIESELSELVSLFRREVRGALPKAAGLPKLQLELGGEASLFEQVSEAVRREASESRAIRPGRIYCYLCASTECAHAGAPRPQSVFSGFSPTGQPLWSDFAQLLVDRKQEDVERLFGDPPSPVACVILGRELKSRMLHGFGKASKSYDVLCQLCAGYFPAARPGQPPFAVTLQAVESREENGATRLAFNRIGLEAAAFFEENSGHWFVRACRTARERLARLETKLASPTAPSSGDRRSEILRQVPGIFHDLRRVVEQAGRQDVRRTRHAMLRREEHRPTPSALRDAASAADEAIFVDEANETLVVLGKNNRVHVFAPDGRLVTSLSLPKSSLSRRIERERWRPATGEERSRLRDGLLRG